MLEICQGVLRRNKESGNYRYCVAYWPGYIMLKLATRINSWTDLISDSADSEDRMATTIQLPAMPRFSVTGDQTTLGQRWSKSVKGLEYFLEASNITDKKQRRAVLRHLAGPEQFSTLSAKLEMIMLRRSRN